MSKAKLQISPSLLDAPRSFAALKKILAQFIKGGIKRVHVDVMDGRFVQADTGKWQNPTLVKKLKRSFPHLKIEVHLMVENPANYFSTFKNAGADLIYFHIEACATQAKALQLAEKLKEMRMQSGIAINPRTKVEKILSIVQAFDSILIMSVQPGKGGQKFRRAALAKIKRLHALKCHVNVDGGVKKENLATVQHAGASRSVVGTGIFKGNAPQNLSRLTKSL